MRSCFLLLCVILGAGCESDTPPSSSSRSPSQSPTIGSAFNPATCGSITGRVTWKGPLPTAADFPHNTLKPDGTLVVGTGTNPYRPLIDSQSLGVAGVVVSLQGIDTATSRPWDLPPVSVEIGNGKIAVIQGERRGRVGFVRRGDAVSISSKDAMYHVLRGRGDAFFSHTLPQPEKPVQRVLNTAGRVELSSGSGLYWMRGDLFVTEHPYFAVTDANGNFTFDRVPSGAVKLLAWHPGWESARTERDPDSILVTRMVYSPALERTVPVEVRAGVTATANVTFP